MLEIKGKECTQITGCDGKLHVWSQPNAWCPCLSTRALLMPSGQSLTPALAVLQQDQIQSSAVNVGLLCRLSLILFCVPLSELKSRIAFRRGDLPVSVPWQTPRNICIRRYSVPYISSSPPGRVNGLSIIVFLAVFLLMRKQRLFRKN